MAAAGNRLLTNVRDYLDRLRGPRVIAVYCDFCLDPVRPRQISFPAVICRDCDDGRADPAGTALAEGVA